MQPYATARFRQYSVISRCSSARTGSARVRSVPVSSAVSGMTLSVVPASMPDPLMGSEDFSYVLDRVPGSLAFLGARPPSVDPALAPPNHSNRVVFDEAAFPAGVAVYAGLALAATG